MVADTGRESNGRVSYCHGAGRPDNRRETEMIGSLRQRLRDSKQILRCNDNSNDLDHVALGTCHLIHISPNRGSHARLRKQVAREMKYM
jgi:hypothetical protein